MGKEQNQQKEKIKLYDDKIANYKKFKIDMEQLLETENDKNQELQIENEQLQSQIYDLEIKK